MIIGIGVDIIEISRISDAIARNGERFLQRVFTEEERAYCEQRSLRATHYAGRFAAKEAAFKALGTGWRGGLSWHHVEVASDEAGAPRLQLSGHARELFERLGATHAHLSLSHTNEHAVAQVVLEARG